MIRRIVQFLKTKIDNSFLNFFFDLAIKYETFINYSIIGVMGVTLDFIVFYLLHNKVGLYYQFANIISVSCGIINNFIFNSIFNFKVKDRLLFRFMQFYLIGSIGILLSSGLLFLFIEMFGIHELISKASIIFIIVVVQFGLNKKFTFREAAS